MFVQVIEGRVGDREGLRRQMDRWMAELRPSAPGYLGTTAGIADDGRGFALARFESAAAAKANSERAEQGRWWAEAEKCFDGEVTFVDSEEVDTFLAGGSDDAGFVQLLKGSASDRERLRHLDSRLAEHAAAYRPDLIGGIRVWTGGSTYTEVAYFTSEAEARANEAKEPPAELAAEMSEFAEMMANIEFIDLREPWLY
ncbi:hypothetical protein PHK61_11535 [Actinomycetospora lutea]|uniref:hypothetical protein n=1 Tax=Actinomycetospora lutea TaxID=663604 RepID=UPI002366A943|nr:hypothetical protein [Actinomycetospora lutea]MDD7939047.1 hypothetical protein [Actinomycetospora lutea]